MNRIKRKWIRFWMRFAGRSRFGRLASRLATWFAPPFFKRVELAYMNSNGYISPKAVIDHAHLITGANVFLGDDVKIYQDVEGGKIEIGNHVHLHRNVTLQTGQGGKIIIGDRSSMHDGCKLIAYKSSLRIGADVQIAANCAFYTYNHGVAPGELIGNQPLTSRGDIVLEDDVNVGHGVIIMDGVVVGKGSQIGAGSVVVQDVSPGVIVMGVPARVIRMRDENPTSVGALTVSAAKGD